jgi:hypothetical protein
MPRLHSPLWPDHSQKPPYGAVEIDGGHPLARGLHTCHLFNGSLGALVNLANPSVIVATGIVGGRGYQTNGSSDYMVQKSPSLAPRGGYTMATRIAIQNTEVTNTYVLKLTGYLNSAQTAVIYGYAARAFETYGDGFGTGRRTILTLSAGDTTFHTVGFSDTGAATTVYSDGVSGGDVSSTGVVSGLTKLSVGAAVAWDDVTISNRCPAVFEWFYVFDRPLAASEHFQLSADPYCFLREVKRRSYGFVGAAAATFVPYPSSSRGARGGLIVPSGGLA